SPALTAARLSAGASVANRVSTRLRTSLILIAVLLGACAPASTSTNPPAAATQPPFQPSTTSLAAGPTMEAPTQPVLSEATEASAPTPLPAATSRGPGLHATDPSTVSLASGQVQFVEFFRFT
ncbi:MAG: hypothetical protein ACXW4U_10055, partial [Anaerolineales bacterium]